MNGFWSVRLLMRILIYKILYYLPIMTMRENNIKKTYVTFTENYRKKTYITLVEKNKAKHGVEIGKEVENNYRYILCLIIKDSIVKIA